VDNQASRKKPRYSVGSYAGICSGGDNRGGNFRERGLAPDGGTRNRITSEVDGATRVDTSRGNDGQHQGRQ
jgi:hypothetical protein